MTDRSAAFESPRAAAEVATLSIGAAVLFIACDLLLTGYAAAATVDLAPDLALSWDDVDRGEQAANVLYAVALIFGATTFIRWQRILVRNGRRFAEATESELDVDERWAAVSWFIPVVPLLAPLRVMKRLAAAAPATATADGPPPARAADALLDVWWLSWVLAAFTGGYANVLFNKAFEIENWLHAAAVDFTSSSLRITAGVLAILVLKRLTALQERTALDLASPDSPDSPASTPPFLTREPAL